MPAQDGTTFEGVFNNPTTGLYKNNTTKDISAEDLRALPTAIKESYLNRLDDLPFVSAAPSTAGGTITLDFTNANRGVFKGSASFATAKVIAFAQASRALSFDFIFTITNAAAGTLEFPATVEMSDARFNDSTQIWEADAVGKYKAHGEWDGTNWTVTITGPYV